MPVRVIVGAQWGDEGKGKIVDRLSRDAHYVVRYQGGANAGHTLQFDDKKVVLHLVPSGIFNGNARCVIGNGVVIELQALLDEIEAIREMGIDLEGRLLVSSAAHVILPYHRVLDQIKEKHRGEDAIGTTGRGIGPAYVSKVSRVGIRMGDLFHPAILEEKVERNLADINQAMVHIYKEQEIETAPIIDEALDAAERLQPYITDTASVLHEAIERGENILLEGAQGSLLDLDHGTYPYVTSSSPTAGGACTGSAIPPMAISHVMGISKAYCTRVGNGPFPTELQDDTGEFLRKQGQEFGATTGRPRRCGWIDLVALKYAVKVNGIDELTITKIDVLDDLDEVKLCRAYHVDGKETTSYPVDLHRLEQVTPVYKTMPGWKTALPGIDSYEDLPAATRNYLDYIQEYLGIELKILSTGPGRTETLILGSI
ncbi:MAG: adenylosuccinate synthase [Balneolaceae bacterium]|nr:adenylosuccinate synthase [Balneolaceae bacterium]